MLTIISITFYEICFTSLIDCCARLIYFILVLFSHPWVRHFHYYFNVINGPTTIFTEIHDYSYTRTKFLSLRMMKSLLGLSNVDRLKDLNIGCDLPRRHRSNRGVKRKKQIVYPFVVASINAQSEKVNDMACRRCEISTFIKDNGVELFFVTETWLSAQGDEAKQLK